MLGGSKMMPNTTYEHNNPMGLAGPDTVSIAGSEKRSSKYKKYGIKEYK